jgi:hypothetical protein
MRRLKRSFENSLKYSARGVGRSGHLEERNTRMLKTNAEILEVNEEESATICSD